MDDMAARSNYHHGDLKNALVDAATRLIETKGLPGLSLRGVAREAGVSQAAPYHHFKDKEALVAEVCCLGFCELGDRMRAAIGEAPSVLDALDQVGHAYIVFAMERRAYFSIMWGSNVEDKSDYPRLQEEAHCTFEMLVGLIAKGQAAGEIRPGAPVEHAMAAWAAVHGAASLLVDKGIDNDTMQELGINRELVVSSTLQMVRRSLTADGLPILDLDSKNA